MRTEGALALSFLILLVGPGFAQEIKPMTISPGSERGVAMVSEPCPTFSWSAVGWAAAYRVDVFEVRTAEAISYEAIALATRPVLTQDIPGKALSWTPSAAERLKDGALYVWYVQARDASGNGLWSAGKTFVVELEKTPIVGAEKRATRRLRERGVSADVITETSREPRGGAPSGAVAKGFTLKGSGQTSAGGGLGAVRTQGSEGDATHYNVYYGYGAGASLTAEAWNSFFGYQAGNKTTSGFSNTYIGHQAGYANTQGYRNTFLGDLAGITNTIGYENTFLGFGAGYYTTTGYCNTFVGRSAGHLNGSGRYNTFLGTFAGYLNVTGANNTIVGYYAGFNGSSGNYNTIIGHCAGYANTTSSNSFLGYSSGRDNTTGTYNSFFGQNAGRHNTTGSNNTYLGLNSAYYNTTGGNNVVMGVNAGFNNAGSGNVFLGYRAGFSETGSNKLYIDNNSDAFPLIYGDFDAAKLGLNGFLGVGVQNPGYRIQVAGGAYCNGTTWTNASSRSLKENIRDLRAEDAQEALAQLAPVRFNYKSDQTEECLGFIAEDVPSLVATADRTGLSPMDVVAVLTKVVQDQQRLITEQQKTNEEQKKINNELRAEIRALKRKT